MPIRQGGILARRASTWPAPPLGHATTFAAARWRPAHRGPRRGTSSCRYRCRSRRSRYWVSETWRAPCLWRPLPASLAGGAGARVAVGTEIALRPPHRSRRALLTHRSLALDGDEKPLLRPRVQDARIRQIALGNPFHPAPRQSSSALAAAP